MASAPPDPDKGFYIFASGKKGTGKSYLCRAWFDSYPYDRLVIDPTHDVITELRRDGVRLVELDADVLPLRFPEPAPGSDERRVTAILAPDMGRETALDDIDRAVGLVVGRKKPALLWIDEAGAVATAHKTWPNTRRVLHHGRHDRLSLLSAAPRPKDINPLFIGQSDLVYTFRTGSRYDIEAIAKEIGWDVNDFAAENRSLRGHEHTMYDAAEDELYRMPELPRRRPGRNVYPPVPA